MRFPNSYGSVIKLSGKRRKPYAVRVTDRYEMVDGHIVQKYKYLEYFEKRTDAITYLSNYNAGMALKEHRSLVDAPTLNDMYNKWLEEKEFREGLSDAQRNNYRAAWNKYEPLHNRKIHSIRLADVQPILDANADKSKGYVSNMLTVIRGAYGCAKRYDYIDNDFTPLLFGKGQPGKGIHKSFTVEEIKKLWAFEHDTVAQFALLTIYTGMRPVEPTLITPMDIHLSERYIVGGVKTQAGRNRIIPIHRKIMPIVEARMERKVLFDPVDVEVYRHWMEMRGMDHRPHDGRHTCSTYLEAAGVPLNRRKLILGHKIKDITDGVYTHVSPEELVKEIDRLAL